jgi:uncharacterized protein
MTKIGILSDTHLDSVTREFKETLARIFNGTDMLIHAGDMTGRSVYDFLCNWDLRAVRGNMDHFDLANLLPESRVETVEGKSIGIIHGRGMPFGIEDLVYQAFGGVDVIIFGHSHLPFYRKKGETILFNPGSYRPSYGNRGTVGLMEIDKEITFRHIEV